MVSALLLVLMMLVAGCASPPGEADFLSDVVQLTHGYARAGEAYFSPDGKWIIFQAVPRGEHGYQMYLAPLVREGERITGTGLPTRISPAGSTNTCGFFSPAGPQLIFASTAGKQQPATHPASRPAGGYRWDFVREMEIFVVDDWSRALGGAGPGEPIDLARKALTSNKVYDAECAVSPDGKWIVYCSMESGDGDLYIMRIDGTDKVRITTAPGYDGGPFFSPDGRRLVYRSDRKRDEKLQLFVCDLAFDSSGKIMGMDAERQITDDGHVNFGPYWHPDGRHIIYATSRHGHMNYELYLVRDDGARPTRITFWQGADVLPVFSPDGKHLMWTSRRSADGTPQIMVARFRMPTQ